MRKTTEADDWTPFFAIFTEGEARGIAATDLGLGLLLSLSDDGNAGQVRGLRRSWQWVEEPRHIAIMRAEKREEFYRLGEGYESATEAEKAGLIAKLDQLRPWIESPDPWQEGPRDAIKRLVPPCFFRCFDRVLPSLTSIGMDPEESANVDWMKGDAEFWGYDDQLQPVRFEYSHIEVSRPLAALILEQPAVRHVVAGTAANVVRHSDDELRDWILAYQGNVNQGFKEYRVHPRYNGIKKPQFQDLWRALRRRGVGRPKTLS